MWTKPVRTLFGMLISEAFLLSLFCWRQSVLLEAVVLGDSTLAISRFFSVLNLPCSISAQEKGQVI